MQRVTAWATRERMAPHTQQWPPHHPRRETIDPSECAPLLSPGTPGFLDSLVDCLVCNRLASRKFWASAMFGCPGGVICAGGIGQFVAPAERRDIQQHQTQGDLRAGWLCRVGQALKHLQELPKSQRGLLVGAARLAAGTPLPSALYNEGLSQLASVLSDDRAPPASSSHALPLPPVHSSALLTSQCCLLPLHVVRYGSYAYEEMGVSSQVPQVPPVAIAVCIRGGAGCMYMDPVHDCLKATACRRE